MPSPPLLPSSADSLICHFSPALLPGPFQCSGCTVWRNRLGLCSREGYQDHASRCPAGYCKPLTITHISAFCRLFPSLSIATTPTSILSNSGSLGMRPPTSSSLPSSANVFGPCSSRWATRPTTPALLCYALSSLPHSVFGCPCCSYCRSVCDTGRGTGRAACGGGHRLRTPSRTLPGPCLVPLTGMPCA